MDLELDVYDADLGNVKSGDNIDPTLGLKLKVYDRSAGDNDDYQLATVLLAVDDKTGLLTLTVYRDVNVPLAIRTVDYFSGGNAEFVNGSDPAYYNVLRTE